MDVMRIKAWFYVDIAVTRFMDAWKIKVIDILIIEKFLLNDN